MYRFIKRFFDFILALLAIIVTSPIWLITIVGIKISDHGPAFFKAQRIGYRGKEFCMWKFRSMRIPKNDEEKSETSFKADNQRIFAFGAFIRRTKIDELPQLINIVKGDMSIVGPRPASKDQVSMMRAGKYNIASTVKPGLTGPAALYDYIYGDAIEDLDDYTKLVLPKRLELEAYYPNHMTLAFDIKMIWFTIICVLASVFKKYPQKIYDELTGYVPVNDSEIFQEVEV